MGIDYYEILVDGVVIASRVTLEWTVTIVKAVFEHLFNEPDLSVTVRKMKEENSTETAPRSGLWIGEDDCVQFCSECSGLGCGTRYCPSCGARMENADGD